MVCLFVQYMAIYRNEICPISSKFYQNGLNVITNNKWTLEKLPKTLIFCQSNEISPNLVTLVTVKKCFAISVPGWQRWMSGLLRSTERNARSFGGSCIFDQNCSQQKRDIEDDDDGLKRRPIHNRTIELILKYNKCWRLCMPVHLVGYLG